MLSINTNLSSLIAQQSMTSATTKLNEAIERMTTGFKINHASDNAANYSIATNMSTQINAYDVAADNVAMGMDLVNTASDIISNMQDKASRLQALCTQARNGTYGAQSLTAINSEASAIISEIARLYTTAEYNGISLFNREAYTIADHLPKAGKSGFIDETSLVATASSDPAPSAKAEYNGFIEDPVTYTDAEVAAMTKVADVSTFTSGQKYSISSVEELEKFRNLVNSGGNTSNVEFVLGSDIDLSSIDNWTPIGSEYEYTVIVDWDENDNPIYGTRLGAHYFDGTFNGNGHSIKNLTINNPTEDYQGLFSSVAYDRSVSILNLKLEDVNVNGADYVAALIGGRHFAGDMWDISIENVIVTGNVSGENYVATIIGGGEDASDPARVDINNCYANATVKGRGNYIGGLGGQSTEAVSISVNSSIFEGQVFGQNYVGGLGGNLYDPTNSYATGTVTGNDFVGGLTGEGSVTNSSFSGNVTGQNYVGGLGGCLYNTTNSYATGTVTGNDFVGGLGGSLNYDITSCYSTSNVVGNNYVGGLGGELYSDDCTFSTISNCYSTGNVSGDTKVGGIAGYVVAQWTSYTIMSESYATGNITGNSNVGGLVGFAETSDCGDEMTITDCVSYSTKISGNESVGSVIGGFCGLGTSDIFTMNNNSALLALPVIATAYTYDYHTDEYLINNSVDLSMYDTMILAVPLKQISTSLQVGIYGDSSNQISFDTNFKFDLSSLEGNIGSDEAYTTINNFINLLSEKSTQLGAIQNRLDSALESIMVNLENLTSSRSTIRDADIAEVSSHYIQQQILQQASATLLATANQSPSIALQLI